MKHTITKLHKLVALCLSVLILMTMLPQMSFAETLPDEIVACSECGQEIIHKSTCSKNTKTLVEYAPLAEGYQEWSGTVNGGTLTTDVLLTGDTYLTSQVVVNLGVYVTIDLNGYALVGPGTDSVIYNEGKLTIRDSRPNHGVHKFVQHDDGPWVMDDVNGTFEITGGLITGGREFTPADANGMGGGAIKQGSNHLNNVLYLQSGTIVGNASTRAGGAIYGGTINMSGGTIIGNYAERFGGAFSLSGQFNMSGGTIVHNETNKNSVHNNPESGAYYQNASVLIGGKSNFAMSGGVIYGVVSTVNYQTDATTFQMTGGKVTGNFRILNGATFTLSNGELHGSIYMKDGDCVVSDTMQIYGGTQTDGGAVCVAGGNFTMNGGNISASNGENGGAVFVSNGTCTMTGGEITGCAATNGGAIYITSGDFLMTGGIITANAAQNGGAVYITGGNITIDGGTLDLNEASINGAAIYVETATDVAINVLSGSITNNTAGNHGGAIGANVTGDHAVSLSVGLESCKSEHCENHRTGQCPVISGNTASQLGGAFCLHSTSREIDVNIYCGTIMGNTAIKNPGSNTLNQSGGQVVVWSGIISPGIMVGGGVYDDNRVAAEQITLRFWANFPDGPAEPTIAEVTAGITMVFPVDTYAWNGHVLSGWATAPNATGLYIPSNGQYTIEEATDGYLDFYAVWDANSSYTITLPEQMEIGKEYTIAAILNYFKEDSELSVNVLSDFTLSNTEGVHEILYTLFTNNSGAYAKAQNEGVVASFNYHDTDDKKLKTEIVSGQQVYSGTYTDELTFIVSYDETNDDEHSTMDEYALVLDNSAHETDKYPLVFVRALSALQPGDTYYMKEYGELPILAVYTGFEDTVYAYNNGSVTTAPWKEYYNQITSIRVLRSLKPKSMRGWFANMTNVAYFDVAKIDTVLCTDFSFLFYAAGSSTNVKEFALNGLASWDTSNVTTMVGTFCGLANNVSNWTINGVASWDTSNVTSMEGMFASAGYSATDGYLDLSGWDLSSCVMTDSMFAHAGRNTKNTFTLVGLDTWDVSSVKDFDSMFYYAGAPVQYTLDVSMWNAASMTTKKNIIAYAGGTILLPDKLK